MFDINKGIEDIVKGLDNLFTSDEERLKYRKEIIELQIKLYDMRAEIEHALIERNKEVAKVSWLGRWPEILALCGILILFVDLVLRPILNAFGVTFLDIDESKILSLLMTLLGIGH